jgi:hypothetical protein
MIVLGAGDEQDAVAESGPRVRLGPAMVGEHNDADLGCLGGLQNFGAGALGVIGILGVDVEDGSEVAIDAGRRGSSGALFHPLDTLRVDGGKVGGVEAFDGGAGED